MKDWIVNFPRRAKKRIGMYFTHIVVIYEVVNTQLQTGFSILQNFKEDYPDVTSAVKAAAEAAKAVQ